MDDCQQVPAPTVDAAGLQAARVQAARDELSGLDLDALPAAARETITRTLAMLTGDLSGRRMPADVGQRAHEAVTEHLSGCWEAMYREEQSDDPADWPESPACAPFCGCEDCVLRETLHAAWPVFEADALVRMLAPAPAPQDG